MCLMILIRLKPRIKNYKIDYFELHNRENGWKAAIQSKMEKEYTVLLERAYRYAKSTQRGF